MALDILIGVTLRCLFFNKLHLGASLAAIKCGRRFLTVHKDVENVRTYTAFPLRCKSWNCPRCADKKSLKYGKLIAQWFVRKQLYFYTLTFFHSVESIVAWKNAAEAWNNLNLRLHKKYGSFSYVKILECHVDSNYPHYHILCDRLFSASSFGKMALAAGFGYQIRIQRVASGGVCGYIRKYLGKSWPREDAKEIRTTLRLRVFTRSNNLNCGVLADSGWRAGRIVACRENAIIYFLSILYSLKGTAFCEDYHKLHADNPCFTFNIPPPRRHYIRPDVVFIPATIKPLPGAVECFDFDAYDARIDAAYAFRGLLSPHHSAGNA